MSFSLPSCSCSERSVAERVFTCSVCVRAALRYWDGERVDQGELFEYVDSTRSVSALFRSRGELTPIASVLRSPGVVPDDLPF